MENGKKYQLTPDEPTKKDRINILTKSEQRENETRQQDFAYTPAARLVP